MVREADLEKGSQRLEVKATIVGIFSDLQKPT